MYDRVPRLWTFESSTSAISRMLIIVDLGNVLYEIDFNRTVQAFMRLPGYNGTPFRFGIDDQDALFEMFDKGQLEPTWFYQNLRTRFGFTASDEEMERAWNSILIAPYEFARDVPVQLRNRFQPQAAELETSLRVVLLSNISEPHLQLAFRTMPELRTPQLMGLDATYFSCRTGVRKPDPQAFLYVCEKEGALPEQAVLFDDSKANVNAARKLGMRASLVTPGDQHLAFRELL